MPATSASAPASSSTVATMSRESGSSSTTSTRRPPRGGAASSHTGRSAAGCGACAGAMTTEGTTAARGSRTVNTAPEVPSVLLAACTVPPCSSTRWRTIARPRPRPPCGRVEEESAWRNLSKTYGRNSGRMPGPSSATESSVCASRRRSRTRTRPPFGANLSALERRFQTTCCRRSASPEIAVAPGSRSCSRRTSRACAAGPTVSRAAFTTSARLIGLTARRSLPAMIRDTSRMSEMSWFWMFAFRSIVSTARRVVSGSSFPERSMCAHPTIAWSGVRSSCDRVARNSSLRRFACCASR